MKLHQRVLNCIAGLALAGCASSEPRAQPERPVQFIPNYGTCVRDVNNDGMEDAVVYEVEGDILGYRNRHVVKVYLAQSPGDFPQAVSPRVPTLKEYVHEMRQETDYFEMRWNVSDKLPSDQFSFVTESPYGSEPDYLITLLVADKDGNNDIVFWRAKEREGTQVVYKVIAQGNGDGTFKRVDSESMEAGFEEWRDELQR